jgi:hypothetical protein
VRVRGEVSWERILTFSGRQDWAYFGRLRVEQHQQSPSEERLRRALLIFNPGSATLTTCQSNLTVSLKHIFKGLTSESLGGRYLLEFLGSLLCSHYGEESGCN